MIIIVNFIGIVKNHRQKLIIYNEYIYIIQDIVLDLY